MEGNEGTFDRLVRGVVGAILLAFVALSLEGPIALIEGSIAAIVGLRAPMRLLTSRLPIADARWRAAHVLLSGVKRTWPFALQMSANDPKRTTCKK